MTPYMLIQWQAFVGDRAHQVDATARTVIFISQFGVGRTSRGTKAAVDAIQEVVVIDIGTRVCRGSWCCVRCGVSADRVGGGQGCIRHGMDTILDSWGIRRGLDFCRVVRGDTESPGNQSIREECIRNGTWEAE